MRVRLGALYLDVVVEDAAATPRPRLTNRLPEAGATSVLVAAAVELTIVDAGAAGLAATTRIFVQAGGVEVLAFDQAGAPQFSAAYAAGSTFAAGASPGSAVTDEHVLRLVRATPWTSLEVVTVRVEAQTADASTLAASYSFTVQDLTQPTIASARTRGLRTLRLRFSEPVVQSGAGAGDATAVREITGRVEFVAPATLRAPAGAFSTLDVGRYIGVIGAADVRNDGYREVATVVSTTEVTLVEEVVMEAAGAARAVIGPYRLAGQPDATLLAPFFLPLVTAAQVPRADQADVGEDLRTLVDLTLHDDLTAARGYTVQARVVADLAGNTMATTPVAFTTEALPSVTRRRFTIWDMLPELNRAEDTTRDLRRLVNVWQEVIDLTLGDVDRLTDIHDVDRCAEGLLDALLYHQGNPFSFAWYMTAPDKRLLIETLPALYRRLGTERGVEDALAFFFGTAFDVVPYSDPTDVWILGEGELGASAILGMDVAFRLYSFDVVSPIALTTAQRRNLIEIVEFARPAHTHFVRLLEPGAAPEPVVTWVLGESTLGGTAVLGA